MYDMNLQVATGLDVENLSTASISTIWVYNESSLSKICNILGDGFNYKMFDGTINATHITGSPTITNPLYIYNSNCPNVGFLFYITNSSKPTSSSNLNYLIINITNGESVTSAGINTTSATYSSLYILNAGPTLKMIHNNGNKATKHPLVFTTYTKQDGESGYAYVYGNGSSNETNVVCYIYDCLNNVELDHFDSVISINNPRCDSLIPLSPTHVPEYKINNCYQNVYVTDLNKRTVTYNNITYFYSGSNSSTNASRSYGIVISNE